MYDWRKPGGETSILSVQTGVLHLGNGQKDPKVHPKGKNGQKDPKVQPKGMNGQEEL